jgi:hypothetical protein
LTYAVVRAVLAAKTAKETNEVAKEAPDRDQDADDRNDDLDDQPNYEAHDGDEN